MEIIEHELKGSKVAEILSSEVEVKEVQDILDLMATVQYNHKAVSLVLKKENLHPDFFDLKTRMAGEILQKITNYHFKLAIIGDFENITSKALKDFIYESNQGKQIIFVRDISSALHKLCS